MVRLARRACALVAGGVLLLLPAAAQAAKLPGASALSDGWQMRDVRSAPAAPQPAPPEETAPDSEGQQPGTIQPSPGVTDESSPFHAVRVPDVFDAGALKPLYPGMVRAYRIRFTGPRAPRGFRWALRFDEVRRSARVYLNGRLIGRNSDPYTPFMVPARGLRAGRRNMLQVVVDNRKDPRLREGWWNWGGIVRPVHLVPVRRANLSGLGLMSRVRCKGRARRCRARFVVDGTLARHGVRRIRPRLGVALRSPSGRLTKKIFRLRALRGAHRRVTVSMRVAAPMLWSPEAPQLYRAKLVLRDRGRVQQVVRKRVGLRSVTVKRGLLYLNNRRLQMRGASIHEDMPGHGAALTRGDMRRIVQDLKDVGANVTRAHYLLDDRLLSMLDRAGIMVWNEAAIWQRDHGANLLQYRSQRRRAVLTVRRTVREARSHPSVITHSVANELSFVPDKRPGTRKFLLGALHHAKDLDPTIPISVDTKGRPGYPPARTYRAFDMLGINQYFGWYRWVSDFNQLEPFLRQERRYYPHQALVMTEFGAEALPELAQAPADQKGGYLFQANHTARTLDLVDRLHFLSGAIYWTLREFEIYPGWTGGAGRRPPQYRPNTRHHKGLLTYDGRPKPAWYVARDRFTRTPLYYEP
jgi:hypothetical protein